MAKAFRLCVGIVTALALCKYPMADQVTESPANATVSDCPQRHDGDNCTDTDSWLGHFSKCPEDLTGYCVHGVCRYLEEHKKPACSCDYGFVGARCEYVDLDARTGGRRAIIIGTIVLLLAIIVVILLIFLSAHFKCRLCWRRRRQRREAPSNVTEKLSMMDTGATQTSLAAEPTETTHTIAV